MLFSLGEATIAGMKMEEQEPMQTECLIHRIIREEDTMWEACTTL